jgi:Zn-dependent protease with chaperone function
MSTFYIAAPTEFVSEVSDFVVRIGLQLGRHFVVRYAPYANNAFATICGDIVLIDFDRLHDRILRLYGAEAVAFVLLHEIGHATDCSVCLSTSAQVTAYYRELVADRFAGRTMRSLGFRLRGAVAFLQADGLCGRCEDHPPPAYRIDALRQGYGQITDLLERLGDWISGN